MRPEGESEGENGRPFPCSRVLARTPSDYRSSSMSLSLR